MDAPIVRSSIQAGALSALSNILGQLIKCWQSNKPYTLNFIELAHFVLFSILASPPNFLWQCWLEAHFPGYTTTLKPAEREQLVDETVIGRTTATDVQSNGTAKGRAKAAAMTAKSAPATQTPSPTETRVKKLNKTNTAIKFALDQTVGAAINTVMFLGGIALIRGNSLDYAWNELVDGFWPLIFAGQKLWPAVSLISFTLVPLERRVVFGSIVGVFWGVIVTLMHGGK